MSINIDNFVCANCQGDQYYEDNAGNLICNYCGIQSQDYIAESHEVEDHQPGHTIRRHTFLSSKAKVKKKEYEPELLDYLIVYQYCLQMIGNSAFQLISSNNLPNKDFQMTLKSLWTRYLEAWKNADSDCEMSFAFRPPSKEHSAPSAVYCYCKTEKLDHPLFPTKPLLLGFLYLVIRIHRLEVIIPDLIRWVEQGLLPYITLWDCLPDTIKVHLHPQYRKLFNQQPSLPYGVISPMNIWFHACSLADAMNIDIPPLNGPLVGYSLIHTLGLPAQVKINFSKLTQLFTTAKPLIGADLSQEYYVEFVMAVVILACMMTEDWMTWNYICRSDYLLAKEPGYEKSQSQQSSGIEMDEASSPAIHAIPTPTHLHQLNSGLFTRNLFSTYVQQVSRTLPKEQHTGNSFQEIFEETFNSLSIEEKLSLQSLQSYSSTFRSSPLYLSQKYSFEDNLTAMTSIELRKNKYAKERKERRKDLKYVHSLLSILNPMMFKKYKSKLRKSYGRKDKRKKSNPTLPLTPDQFQVKYATPCRYQYHDLSGRPLVQYTILVERCAKFLYVTPMLLHVIIQSFDLQIVELMLYGKVTAPQLKEKRSGRGKSKDESEEEEEDEPKEQQKGLFESDDEEEAVVENKESKTSDLSPFERLAQRSQYYQNILTSKNPIYKDQEEEILRKGRKRQEVVMASNRVSWQAKVDMEEMKAYREEAEFNFPLISRIARHEEEQRAKVKEGHTSSEKINSSEEWNYDQNENWWGRGGRSVKFQENFVDMLYQEEGRQQVNREEEQKEVEIEEMEGTEEGSRIEDPSSSEDEMRK